MGALGGMKLFTQRTQQNKNFVAFSQSKNKIGQSVARLNRCADRLPVPFRHGCTLLLALNKILVLFRSPF